MAHGDFLEAKVVVLGSQGVGKTSLVSRFVQQTFSTSGTSTVGASFLTKKLIVDHRIVKLQIWDTAGQERFRSMAPMYYRGANAAILVYDVTSEESFLDVSSWVQELKKNVAEDLIMHIVGSKLDLSQNHRAVHPGLAAEYARTCNTASAPCFSPSSPESNPSLRGAQPIPAPATSPNTPYLPKTVTLRRSSVQHYRHQQHQSASTDHLQSSYLHRNSNSFSPSRFPTQGQSFSQPHHARPPSNPPSPDPVLPVHRRATSHTSSSTQQSISSSASSSTTIATLPAGPNPELSPSPKRTQSISFPPPGSFHFQFPVLPVNIVPTTSSPESKKSGRIFMHTNCSRLELPGPIMSPALADGSPRSPPTPTVTWSEVSSKDDEGVQALFTDLARRLVAREDEIEKNRKKGGITIGARSDAEEGSRKERWDRSGRGAACCAT